MNREGNSEIVHVSYIQSFNIFKVMSSSLYDAGMLLAS